MEATHENAPWGYAFYSWDLTLQHAPAIAWSLLVSNILIGLCSLVLACVVFRLSLTRDNPIPDLHLIIAMTFAGYTTRAILNVLTMFSSLYRVEATVNWMTLAFAALSVIVLLTKYPRMIQANIMSAKARVSLATDVAELNARLRLLEEQETAAMLRGRGKTGATGERGERGQRGEKGEPG